VTKASLCSVLLAVLTTTTLSASAQGLTDWVDGCEATAPDLQALLADDAVLVEPDLLVSNFDGTYMLLNEPFTEVHAGIPLPLCPGARFHGQPRVIYPSPVQSATFRSAVQVGRDLVLTAWHGAVAPPGSLTGLRVVFGIRSAQVASVCQAPDFAHIPASQVYEVVEVVADGMTSPGDLDFLLLRVDRVIDDEYPRVRRSGWGQEGDSATVIGHYERTAAKVDLAGTLGSVVEFNGYPSQGLWGIHTGDGNSGSMVYNRTERFLETLVSKGPRGIDYDLTGGGCYEIVEEEDGRPTNASLRFFAQHIPAFELLVLQLDTVVHQAALGGILSNAVSTRRVAAPSTAAGPIDYQVVPPAAPVPGEPTLTITSAAPFEGTLAPSDVMAIQQTASAHSVPCGTYHKTYAIRDVTHGLEDVARHRFEIGLSQFTVSADPFERPFQDIAPPFENVEVYDVANPQPTPVTVVVSSNASWITLNGAAEATLEIPGYSSLQVVVGVADAMRYEPHGLYTAIVTFAAEAGSPCLVSAPVTREFRLDWGTENFSVPAGVPIPATLTFDVPEAFCIGNLFVSLGATGVPPNQLRIGMTSPSGAHHDVWVPGGTNPPGGNLDVTLDVSAFDGLKGKGLWTLTVADETLPVTGTFTRWEMMFQACPLP
jgi:hypothetical protein